MDGDKVILRGTVHSWHEREEAERAAWRSPGVKSVEDDITVAAWTLRTTESEPSGQTARSELLEETEHLLLTGCNQAVRVS